MASSAAEVRSGVWSATPARRRAASSTSAAVGSATGASIAPTMGTTPAPMLAPTAAFATVAPRLHHKQGHSRRGIARRLTRTARRDASVEAARGMCQHGVDLAGIGNEIIAGHCRTAIAPRNIVEQPFELVDVVLDGLAKFGIGSVLVANFVERLLARLRIEGPGESATLAPLIAFPQVGGGFVVDHPRDIHRKRID